MYTITTIDENGYTDAITLDSRDDAILELDRLRDGLDSASGYQAMLISNAILELEDQL